MGDIDRVNPPAQTTQLVNAFQRVNPADQRHSAKRDAHAKDDQGDKVELTKDEEEKPDEEQEVVDPKAEDSEKSEHLDLAV